MASIIDYIQWRGDLDFHASPFNPVDNLILSELSYMNFSQVIKANESATIKEMAHACQQLDRKKGLGVLLTGDFEPMLDLMATSKRYGDLTIRECVEIIDEDLEMQFAAMTFEIDRETDYIAFRGTDDTLVGWKEDFKMSFLDVVPAQKAAVVYVNKVANSTPTKKLLIGGHSKGGNLAVYSAVYADQDAKDQILKVYNNDGPGFKKRVLDTDEYKDISDRIVTLVPQSSVVGMLLEHEESYHVVKSRQIGVLQHDGFNWEVMGADFEYLSHVKDDSLMVDMTVKKVLNAMSLQQREDFTNVLFEILSVNESRTLVDIKNDGLKSLFTMSKNFTHLDKETKRAISKTMSLFFEEGFRSFLEVKSTEQWNLKLANFTNDIQKRFKQTRMEKRALK